MQKALKTITLRSLVVPVCCRRCDTIIKKICWFVADNCSLREQLTSLQEAQKEVLQFLKERDEEVAKLENELQNVRQQMVAAQDLAQGLQLENARYAVI